MFKELASKLTPLTRTQKRRPYKVRIVQKMKNTLLMLTETKGGDKQVGIQELKKEAFFNTQNMLSCWPRESLAKVRMQLSPCESLFLNYGEKGSRLQIAYMLSY